MASKTKHMDCTGQSHEAQNLEMVVVRLDVRTSSDQKLPRVSVGLRIQHCAFRYPPAVALRMSLALACSQESSAARRPERLAGWTASSMALTCTSSAAWGPLGKAAVSPAVALPVSRSCSGLHPAERNHSGRQPASSSVSRNQNWPRHTACPSALESYHIALLGWVL